LIFCRPQQRVNGVYLHAGICRRRENTASPGPDPREFPPMIRCRVTLLFPASANIAFPIRTPSFPSTSVEMFSSSKPTTPGTRAVRSSGRQMRVLAHRGQAQAPAWPRPTDKEISMQSDAANELRGENMNHPQQAERKGERTHCDTILFCN
jgi:hypothetical protein